MVVHICNSPEFVRLRQGMASSRPALNNKTKQSNQSSKQTNKKLCKKYKSTGPCGKWRWYNKLIPLLWNLKRKKKFSLWRLGEKVATGDFFPLFFVGWGMASALLIASQDSSVYKGWKPSFRQSTFGKGGNLLALELQGTGEEPNPCPGQAWLELGLTNPQEPWYLHFQALSLHLSLSASPLLLCA